MNSRASRTSGNSSPGMCSRVAAPTRLRRMPAADEGAGLVKFTRESVLAGEDARPILDAFVKQVAATGRDLAATGLRLVDRALTVADPVTLRPQRVLHEELRTLEIKDVPDRTDRERHEYTFEWPVAAPPPAKTEK